MCPTQGSGLPYFLSPIPIPMSLTLCASSPVSTFSPYQEIRQDDLKMTS